MRKKFSEPTQSQKTSFEGKNIVLTYSLIGRISGHQPGYHGRPYPRRLNRRHPPPHTCQAPTRRAPARKPARPAPRRLRGPFIRLLGVARQLHLVASQPLLAALPPRLRLCGGGAEKVTTDSDRRRAWSYPSYRLQSHPGPRSPSPSPQSLQQHPPRRLAIGSHNRTRTRSRY
jgi:hypothetical protein